MKANVELSISLMSFKVECKVIGPGKSSITMWAFEWFDPSVFSEVASEFSRADILAIVSGDPHISDFVQHSIISLSLKRSFVDNRTVNI